MAVGAPGVSKLDICLLANIARHHHADQGKRNMNAGIMPAAACSAIACLLYKNVSMNVMSYKLLVPHPALLLAYHAVSYPNHVAGCQAAPNLFPRTVVQLMLLD